MCVQIPTQVFLWPRIRLYALFYNLLFSHKNHIKSVQIDLPGSLNSCIVFCLGLKHSIFSQCPGDECQDVLSFLLSQTILLSASLVKGIFAHKYTITSTHRGFWRGLTLQVPANPSKSDALLAWYLLLSKLKETKHPTPSSLSWNEERGSWDLHSEFAPEKLIYGNKWTVPPTPPDWPPMASHGRVSSVIKELIYISPASQTNSHGRWW